MRLHKLFNKWMMITNGCIMTGVWVSLLIGVL